MAAQTTEAQRRSKVAEACVDFGRQLLRSRPSSVTADDAQRIMRELFEWFETHGAFAEGNYGIAIRAVAFGEELLESRNTSTPDDAVKAIQGVYEDLME